MAGTHWQNKVYRQEREIKGAKHTGLQRDYNTGFPCLTLQSAVVTIRTTCFNIK